MVGTGTFATQATLANETTKVIGTVNQGTNPWISAGNQSNAAGGTTGSANIGVNAYLYGWTGSGWSQGIINNNGSAVSANSSPVVIASDNALPSGWKGQAAMTGSVPVVLANNQAMADPCTYALKTTVPFSTGTSGAQLFAGTSAKNSYICSLSVIASAAANFSIVAGSGSSVCTGGTPIALIGSTTAANGFSFAANGGLTLGNGNAIVMSDKAAVAQAYNICILINGTANLAGNLTYVQQ